MEIFNTCKEGFLICLREVILPNWILSLLSPFLLLTLIFGIYIIWKNTHFLLKENGSALGRGLGKHFGDRFIRIWYLGGLMYGENSFEDYLKHMGLGRFRHNTKAIDNELAKMKLIEIDKHEKKVYPMRSWKNKLTLKIVIYWLVIFRGDKFRYYKDMEKEMKKNN